jgi:CheY-like chemotaxis protein
MLPGNPYPISINRTVEDTAALLRRMLPSTIVLLVDLDRAVPLALADPGQIQQALFNLCTNARDAMPDGGTLQISTRTMTVTRSSGDSPLDSGSYVEIQVSDTGIGIPAEIMPRIFEPFFTTRPVGQGTGLGLAMVYGIVSHHRGRVDVESAPGRGSTFRVLLPAAAHARAEEPEVVVARAPETSLRGYSLLVVDDEPGVLDYASGVLESAGASVVRAANGDEALARLAESPTRFHAVLLDLTMPGTPARLVVEGMRRRVPGLPIVLTSGFASDTAARDGMPVLPFLQKPYPPARLVELMTQALMATSSEAAHPRERV